MPFQIDTVNLRRHNDLLWELTEPLVYSGRDESWTVPAGFCTDFASVPRIVDWLIPRWGAYTLAAILHDWFCTLAIQAELITGREADGVFRRVMREEKVPVTRRWLMWCGVRWGALFNPVRRGSDWWKDAPLVLLITVLALPLVAPGALINGLSLLVYAPVEKIFGQ